VTDPRELAVEIVDAINDLAGRHEGHRAVHAKGTLLAGTLTATPEGAALTRAAHLQGDQMKVTARFSNGGGDPGGPDHGQDGRGLAVKAYLPDGSTTDFVSVNLPCFFVRTPEDFLEFTRARVPDPETGRPDMAKLGPFFEAHPEAMTAIQAALSPERPESYASVRYNGIHTFRWIPADGEPRWVRWVWEPVGGEATISKDAAKERGDDYLLEEVEERASAGGVAFDLVVTLGEDDDPLADPTAVWPEEREKVVAARLELTGPDIEREQEGDVLVFDPMRVTDGIEPSDDQILHIRSHAYAESVLRRSGVARGA
jgi:catalase